MKTTTDRPPGALALDLPLLSPNDAAGLLGVSAGTLAAWRCEKRGPAYYKIGGKVKYSREVLDEWVEKQRHDPASRSSAQLAPLSVAPTPGRLLRRRPRLGGYRTQADKAREAREQQAGTGKQLESN